MAKLKDLKVTIGLSKKGLTKLNGDIRRMKGNFRRNFGEISAMASRLGGMLVSAVGAGLTAVIKSGAKLQTLEVGFRSLMGGAEEASKMVQQLNKFTAQTPFQLEDVARSARQLLAVGTAADNVNARLKMLGDIAAASGNSIGDIAATFAKVQAKGKVELESLNQLAERNIPIFDALREVTGDANMEFGAGAVSVEQYNQALANMAAEGGFAEDAMANLSETLDGKLSTALDNAQQALGDFAKESGLLDAVTNTLDDFTAGIQHMTLSTDDLQEARDNVYDLRQAFKTATKDNVQGLRDQTREAELFAIRLQTKLGKDAAGGHLAGVRALLNEIDEAMAFGTLPDAPDTGATTPPETLEEFTARLNAAADLREEQERLNEATFQHVVTAQDEAEALAGVTDAMFGMQGGMEVLLNEEEELFDEDSQERIAEGTRLIQNAARAANNVGAIFGTMSSLVGAAFDNIKDSSQGFHLYIKSMLEDLLKRAAALVATFAALMLITGGSAGALKALGADSFKGFFMGGMGLAGFADGGLVTGATLAMVGEGPGTSLSNPEVIAPLDKLQQMMGGGNVTVTGRLDGRDILISSERAGFDRNRVRGF